MGNLSLRYQIIFMFGLVITIGLAIVSGDQIQRGDSFQGLTGAVLTLVCMGLLYFFLDGMDIMLTRSQVDIAEAQLDEAKDVQQDNPSNHNINVVRQKQEELTKALVEWRQACERKMK